MTLLNSFRGASLKVKRGEFIVLFGLSGGGKTTLLNLMGTIDRPTKGEIHICGHLIDHKTSDDILSQIRLRRIGFVFQTFNLINSLTALENVEIPMILSGHLTRQERRERAIQLLKKVGMEERMAHYPNQLSGGEQQRVTIARSIANDPDILLLDEPTGDLDTINTNIVMQLLTDLNRDHKITLVMVTHDVSMKGFADRVVWMRDGKIVRVESNSISKKEERMNHLNQDLLKGRLNISAKVGSRTTIRKPQDYKTHPKYVERESESYQFKKMSLRKYEDQLKSILSHDTYVNLDHKKGKIEAFFDRLRIKVSKQNATEYELQEDDVL